jgi:glucose-6-phosphate isomerase
MSDRTLLPAWQSLQAHAASVERHHLRQLFADDPGRFDALSVTALDFLYDFTRQRLTGDTLLLLLALARDCGLEERIRALFAGEAVNLTERRAALHMALRKR